MQAWARFKKATILKRKISYQFLKVRNLYQKISYRNWIADSCRTSTKPTVSKTYDMIFSDTNCNDMKLSISQWNWWKIEIMSEINNLRIISICWFEMVTKWKIL